MTRLDVQTTMAFRADETVRRLRSAAVEFVKSLSPTQRFEACSPFTAKSRPFLPEDRKIWNYRPNVSRRGTPLVEHRGLRLVNMTIDQQDKAFRLLESGLSQQGMTTVRSIMRHELLLREHERGFDNVNFDVYRDPECYWWTVFGDPADTVWGCRVAGHHMGLNFTIVGDALRTVPLFFGVYPATVERGPQAGLRQLVEEEDLARALVQSLQGIERESAIVASEPPIDIIADAHVRAYRAAVPDGLPLAAMGTHQRDQLVSLIRHYLGRVDSEISRNEWRHIEAGGLESISFAWAGPTEPGQRHYYAVKGPTFMIEYDKTQDNGNHIHSVWRSFDGDHGEDILAAHYATDH